MHCGKKWWIREFVAPYIFPLNPDYVAARSLRSLRSNNDDLISDIEAEMLSFSQKGGIIVQGDYNARTGEIQEVVMNDDNTFLPVPEDYEIDSQLDYSFQKRDTLN